MIECRTDRPIGRFPASSIVSAVNGAGERPDGGTRSGSPVAEEITSAVSPDVFDPSMNVFELSADVSGLSVDVFELSLDLFRVSVDVFGLSADVSGLST